MNPEHMEQGVMHAPDCKSPLAFIVHEYTSILCGHFSGLIGPFNLRQSSSSGLYRYKVVKESTG